MFGRAPSRRDSAGNGKAEVGTIVRHPTDPKRKLDKKAAEKLPTQPYYLVFPVGIDHFGDSYVINDARYEDPADIFTSRAEAEAYAAEHSYWLLDWTVPGLTSHIASFDLLKLPTCDEICQLLHIEDRSNWREALNNYSPSSLSTSDQNRLIKLLGLRAIASWSLTLTLATITASDERSMALVFLSGARLASQKVLDGSAGREE